MITIVAVIDPAYSEIVTGPEVISRGFVYAKESEALIDSIKTIARDTIELCFDRGNDWSQMKFKIKDEVAKFVNQQTKRKPMIVPIIMEI